MFSTGQKKSHCRMIRANYTTVDVQRTRPGAPIAWNRWWQFQEIFIVLFVRLSRRHGIRSAIGPSAGFDLIVVSFFFLFLITRTSTLRKDQRFVAYSSQKIVTLLAACLPLLGAIFFLHGTNKQEEILCCLSVIILPLLSCFFFNDYYYVIIVIVVRI